MMVKSLLVTSKTTPAKMLHIFGWWFQNTYLFSIYLYIFNPGNGRMIPTYLQSGIYIYILYIVCIFIVYIRIYMYYIILVGGLEHGFYDFPHRNFIISRYLQVVRRRTEPSLLSAKPMGDISHGESKKPCDL
jgi:hypothetical protein